jgi:hypothetical protein
VRFHQNEKSLGGKSGSIAILNELSSIEDITRVSNGHGSSKHGLVFHSIR